MSSSFRECAAIIERLDRAVLDLHARSQLLQLPSLEEAEWYQLLRQKLVPQLLDEQFLVVAVVGGTNIGKSVVFNHLAQSRASATSPFAAGTKHPVCLVPPGFEDRHDLAKIFEGFELQQWMTAEAPLEEREDGADLLFWRTSPQTPENLLVLDTPDVDSDALINWKRADKVRRSADVLVAVLTQQKHNDAAVKTFFRKAAAEGKVVVVVFNQVQIEYDYDIWPRWLEVFCRGTGISPEIVYLTPIDRAAAEEQRLPFYEQAWPPAADGEGAAAESEGSGNGQPGEADTAGQQITSEPRDLSKDLSRLRFHEIKLRTLYGSMRHLLDRREGVPAFLQDVQRRSGRFQSATELMATELRTVTDDWPTVPQRALIGEIRHWWQDRREGWSAKVHGFYNVVGDKVAWPFRFARDHISGPPPEPFEVYRRQEWSRVLETVERIYTKLTELSELGHELLSVRLEQLLAGTSRVELLRTLEAAHEEIDLQAELRDLVQTEMNQFYEENPQIHRLMKRIDEAAAVGRPALSVVLFMTGFGPAGDVAAQMVAEGATQVVLHVAGDLAGGTVAATVGDAAVGSAASGGAGAVEARLRRMHAAYVARRAQWLLEMLDQHLWGGLLEELYGGATTSQSDAYRRVEQALADLGEQLESHAAGESVAISEDASVG